MAARFLLQLGDITSMNVEAIVNSSDSTLLEGGPVHTAVHGAAGPGLKEECEALEGCPVGEARITAAHDLGARHIIHTVAPTWNWGGPAEERALALASSPFIAVSRSFFKRNRSAFQPGVFLTLAERIPLEEMKIKSCFQSFRPDQEPRRAEEWVIRTQIEKYRRLGVVIGDFGNFYIEGEPPIGEGTVISTGSVIRGNSEIGRGTVLYPHCYIENSRIGDQCVLLPGTVVIDSIVEEHVHLGPYTHLRNGSLVKKGAKMGNFVEMKKSILGPGSKSMHLSYIGDAMVGENVNIGAGTITCNYDGEKKNPTFIEDNVFIGSGTELVAPVTVHRNSFIAAGSTITEDVPENALAFARQRQANISDWVLRKREKKKG